MKERLTNRKTDRRRLPFYVISFKSQSRWGDENGVIYIDENGKRIVINEDDDIHLNSESVFNTNEDFKDALLTSLYSQVEFLRNEMAENNRMINSLIKKVNEMCNRKQK